MPEAARQRQVVVACFLGWTLDAFDFWIMAFALDPAALEFGVSRTSMTWAIWLTLGFRPLGALVFGRLADRFGRRPVLMANVLIYSALEFFSGFAPTLLSFLVLRALYGVAMGGEWGVGAALTMESIPARWRGPVSGLLQAGYPCGYLLATLLNWAFFPLVGWRGLFMIGVLPAFLVLYIRRNVPESLEGQQARTSATRVPLLPVLQRHLGLTVFAIAMMAGFNFFSHGAQDLYKSFLTNERHLALPTASAILICMNVAAMAGGIFCATLSQRVGRRRVIILAALLALPIVPIWAFALKPLWIGVSAVLIQLSVQGAWGVVPAHLNEISPPEARGTFPGLTYQLGNLIAAPTAFIQSDLADHFFGGNLSWPLAIVVGGTAIAIVLLIGFGPEARDRRMGRELVDA